MSGFMGLARRVAVNQDGATAIEYAFLAALIATAIIGSVQAVGVQLESTFTDVEESFPD